MDAIRVILTLVAIAVTVGLLVISFRAPAVGTVVSYLIKGFLALIAWLVIWFAGVLLWPGFVRALPLWFWFLLVIGCVLTLVATFLHQNPRLVWQRRSSLSIVPLIGTVLAITVGIGLIGVSISTINSVNRSATSHKTNGVKYEPFSSYSGCSGQKELVVTDDLKQQGYSSNQFVIGQSNFKHLPVVDSGGYGDFSNKPIVNSTQLAAFLKSNSSSANQEIQQAMVSTGATRSEVLDLKNWVGFQVLTSSKWTGNTEFVNGQTNSGPTLRVPSGDIGWVFVNPIACSMDLGSATSPAATAVLVSSVKTAVLRGPCGNLETKLPTPTTPPTSTPTTPPTSTPTPCNVCTTATDVTIPPQDQNPGVYVGPTQGAPTTAPSTTPGPTPETNSPAPSPNPSGYDSGSGSSSGTPGGSTCTGSGSTQTCTTSPSGGSGGGTNNGTGGDNNTGTPSAPAP